MKIHILLVFFGLSISNTVNAQLSFCSGNSGDPIYFDDFGSGTTNGPALPAGTTSYTYANSEPDDGFYTISSNTNWFGWHNTQDHTPGDTNGRSLIVNADFTAGEFYRTSISGLCDNTTYEFSSWLLNLLPPGGFCGTGIPINVKFQIWDSTDTILLASGDTGDIQGTDTPIWEEYGLVFTTTAGQSSVILKMINNGVGGCGNDLAIDDIVFKTCGDFISVENPSNDQSVTICSYEIPYSTTLEAIPDFSVFSSHFYQWQQSSDGINWVDIVGEINQNYDVNGIIATTHYRVKVAESAANLANDSCNTISEQFEIFVFEDVNAPTSLGDVFFNCTANFAVLSVSVPNDVTVNWYDSATNGNLLQSNSSTYTTSDENNTFYAEAQNISTGCISQTRTAVSVNRLNPNEPLSNGNVLFDCDTNQAILSVTVPAGVSVNWYDENNNLLLGDSLTYTVEETGLYFAEAIITNTGCVSNNRTQIEVLSNNPSPPTSNGDVVVNCSSDEGTLSVTVPNGITVNWYDAAIGGNLLESNTLTYSTTLEGIYFAEAINTSTGCISTQRTAINFSSLSNYPDLTDEVVTLCNEESITLDGGFFNASYLWSTGETTREIVVNDPGTYTVTVTNSSNCSSTKTVEVLEADNPTIQSINSNGYQLIITTDNMGDYEYSLDGIYYQSSNVFFVEGGFYTVYVQGLGGCGRTFIDYLHFVIPKFFTPNNDGQNDFFELKGIERFSSSSVRIFDRYGKLLFETKDQPVAWDGTFKNQNLPTSDYWYLIEIEDQVFQGHFTLKR